MALFHLCQPVFILTTPSPSVICLENLKHTNTSTSTLSHNIQNRKKKLNQKQTIASILQAKHFPILKENTNKQTNLYTIYGIAREIPIAFDRIELYSCRFENCEACEFVSVWNAAKHSAQL